jgi:hypothetical protein
MLRTSLKCFFKEFRLSKLNILATLVSSANPSALSVSHFDSDSKQGLFSDLIASRIAGCGMLSLPKTVLGTCRWLKTLAISGQSTKLGLVPYVMIIRKRDTSVIFAPFPSCKQSNANLSPEKAFLCHGVAQKSNCKGSRKTESGR